MDKYRIKLKRLKQTKQNKSVSKETSSSIATSTTQNIIQNKTREIQNLFRVDKNNVGDMYSTPCKYFDFNCKVTQLDILGKSTKQTAPMIVGGGGMLIWKNKLSKIIRNKSHPIIFWGIGVNDHHKRRSVIPSFVKDIDLYGIRDDIQGYHWVPCPSCMHSLFDIEYNIKHDIIFYQHKNFQIGIDEQFPLMTNKASIGEVIPFLGSGNIVITNSYHGVYWSTLLGKKVLIVSPFSSKFFYLKYPCIVSDKNNWQSNIYKAQIYGEALEQCRERTISYYNKVMNIISSRS